MKRGISTLFAVGLFLFSANVTFASVRINEIAWMGTAVSGTDEWIELYNDGASAVDMTGWKIDADDGSPSITLSGNISGGGYYLIERTDDDTVPNITADLIAPFGNGLGNAGETLRLKDTSGTSVDTVTGGTDWANIGGDNATKETPQRTANSWVTGVPTPRAENVAQGGEVLGAGTSNSTTNESGSSTTTTNPVSKSSYPPGVYPRKNISVQAGDDKRGFTGFAIAFTGSSSGLYDETIDRATYRWNFGDGAATEGKAVTHTYDIVGEYVVTLEVFWGNYRASDRLSVTITDPDVVVSGSTLGAKGYVTLMNRTDREVDLSGWSLVRSDGIRFVFPPNSFILPKKNFLLSNRVAGLVSGEGTFTLRSPDDLVIFSSPAVVAETPRSNMAGVVAGATVVRSPSTLPQPTRASDDVPVQTAPSSPVATSGATETASAILWEKSPAEVAVGVGSLSYDLRGGMKWSFALLALVLIVLAGFLIARSNAAEVSAADEYAIIEDIIESREDLDGTR